MAGRLTYWIAHRGETVAPDGSVTRETPVFTERGKRTYRAPKPNKTRALNPSAAHPDFIASAILLHPYSQRDYPGWTSAMAHLLGVTPRQVCTWAWCYDRRGRPRLPPEAAERLADILIEHSTRALQLAHDLRAYAVDRAAIRDASRRAPGFARVADHNGTGIETDSRRRRLRDTL